jgi:hypothetical protein
MDQVRGSWFKYIKDAFKAVWSDYRAELCIVVLGLILMHIILVAGAFRDADTINPTGAGQFGDFVGGYVGTLFSLLSVVLLFITLRSQRRAAAEENFETKYFELVKMHRENVAEFKLQDTQGRRGFILLLREFREIAKVVRNLALKHDLALSKRDLIHIAYNSLYFGVGPNSSRMLKLSLSKFDKGFIDELEATLDSPLLKDKIKAERNFGYVPFEGHQSRLGHYYRHLYQTVCYVDNQVLGINKYEYVKTVRAQLTTHEQALLLINSLAPMGQNWWRKDLIKRYRMVQNLPQDFFDKTSELDIQSIFGPGYFEWEDTLNGETSEMPSVPGIDVPLSLSPLTVLS